jgi:hypothetical protein
MALEFTVVEPSCWHLATDNKYTYAIKNIPGEGYNLSVRSLITSNVDWVGIFESFEDAEGVANEINENGYKAFYYPAHSVTIGENGEFFLEGCCGLELLEDIDPNDLDRCAIRRWGFGDQKIAEFPNREAAEGFLAVFSEVLGYFQSMGQNESQ